MYRYALVLAILSALAAARGATAQVSSNGLISKAAAARFGLERVWFTQIEVDRARGNVGHMTQHVSSSQGYTVFEIDYEGGSKVITERDLDRFGEPLGLEGAQKLAQRTVEDLELLGRNPKQTTQVIADITLLVVTNRAVVHAIDAQNGRTHWTSPIGTPRHPSEAAGANDHFVAAVNGSNLYILDKQTGKRIWQRTVVGAPGAGPALSDRYVFVPMLDGTIESYQLDDHRQPPWIYQSHGRAVIQPIVTAAHVVWPTDRGHLCLAEANSNGIRFRLETTKTIESMAVPLTPDRVLVASTDGYVYCVQEISESIQWRFSTGEPILISPVVIGDKVLVITDDDSMFQISATDGRELWQVDGIRGFLAASPERLYCLNRSGRLTLLDLATGTKIGTIPTESLDLTYGNRQTDRIFVGTRRGVLQCLRESQLRWPVIHHGGLEEDSDAESAEDARARKPADATPQPKPPAAADPFGTGGGSPSDPFGGSGAGGTDPFGGGSGGAADDPFGGSSGGAADDPFGGGSSGGTDPFGGGGSGGTDPF